VLPNSNTLLKSHNQQLEGTLDQLQRGIGGNISQHQPQLCNPFQAQNQLSALSNHGRQGSRYRQNLVPTCQVRFLSFGLTKVFRLTVLHVMIGPGNVSKLPEVLKRQRFGVRSHVQQSSANPPRRRPPKAPADLRKIQEEAIASQAESSNAQLGPSSNT
jgi:hypothetical protein